MKLLKNSVQIEIKTSAKKELATIPKIFAEKIIVAIKTLAFNQRPQGSKKLVCAEHTYRITLG